MSLIAIHIDKIWSISPLDLSPRWFISWDWYMLDTMSSWSRSWGRMRTSRSPWSRRRGAPTRVEFTQAIKQEPWITIEQYRSVSFFLAFLNPWRVKFIWRWWIWAFCPSVSKQRLINICWWKLHRFVSSHRIASVWMWRSWRSRRTWAVKQQRFRLCFGFNLSIFNPRRFKCRNTNRFSRFGKLSKERFVDRWIDKFYPPCIRWSHAWEQLTSSRNPETYISRCCWHLDRSYTLHFLRDCFSSSHFSGCSSFPIESFVCLSW